MMALLSMVPLLCCLIVCGGAAGDVTPGVVARITWKGLDYARQIGISVLQENMSSIHIPDYQGSSQNMSYAFYNLIITDVQLPTSQISLDRGLKVSINHAAITMHGRWKINDFFELYTGFMDLKAMEIYISAVLSFGSDGDGRPVVNTSSCSANIGSMPVDFTPSTLDWLTNFFQQTTWPTLRANLQNLICEQVTLVVKDQLEPLLQTLPISADLDDVAAINYSLTSPPNMVGNSMDVKMKGEVFEVAHHSTPPFSPQPVSLPNDYKLMVYIAISDYLFSTAGFTYQYAGKLVFNITDDMIPQGAAVRLNTSSFAIIIPQLKTKYPNLPMKLMVTSPSAPFVNIIQKNVSLALELDIQVFAILPNSSLAPLFLLKLFSMAFAKAEVISDRIVGTLDPTRVHIELEHSYIGPFSMTFVECAMNLFLSVTILPKVNDILSKGFPLPLLDCVELENITLTQYQHYFLLGADLSYG